MTRDVAARLRSEDVDLLRVLWCDNANVIRAKSIFLPPLHEAATDDDSFVHELERSITVSVALQALPVTHDEPATAANLPPVKDVRLVPDWTSLVDPATATGSSTGIAVVIGDMVDGESPWAVCPRDYLRRTCHRAAEQGLVVEVGTELEFFLLLPEDDPTEFPTPVDRTLYASTVAAERSREVVGEILRTLWEHGVPVEQYYPESGPGQHEITLGHCAAPQLADRIVHARETIRAVAARHGLIASFVPLLFEEATGSGMHVHTSLRNDRGESLMADPNGRWGLSTTAESFVAGVLEHLPALMATTTPSPNSYRRIRPHEWSGAYQAWGLANKEAALRVIGDPIDDRPQHVELKTVDASANPYVAIASLVACGLDGVSRGAELPEPVTIDPGNFTDDERAERGIRPLPTDLGRAIVNLAGDAVLRDAMGAEFATAYLAVRRMEFDVMRGMSLDEERRLLLERY